MSLIKNLIDEPEKKRKANDGGDDSGEDEKTVRPMIKSATDLQRLKIEKLMKNPDKPVQIPNFEAITARRNREIEPPSFVRNVMGSSAGAGSGEFHVYRHLRRKEYARQKGIQIKSLTEQLDQKYQEKLEGNRRIADEKTAKKRAKRLKKKQRAKQAKKCKPNSQTKEQDTSQHDTTDEANSDDDGVVDEKVEKQEESSIANDCDEPASSCAEKSISDDNGKEVPGDENSIETNSTADDAVNPVQEDLNKVD